MLQQIELDRRWAEANETASNFESFHKLSAVTFITSPDIDKVTGIFIAALHAGLGDTDYPELLKLLNLTNSYAPVGFRIMHVLRSTVTMREGSEGNWDKFFNSLYRAHVKYVEMKSLARYVQSVKSEAIQEESVYKDLLKVFSISDVFTYSPDVKFALATVMHAKYEMGDLDFTDYGILLEIIEHITSEGADHIGIILGEYIEDNDFVTEVENAYHERIRNNSRKERFYKTLKLHDLSRETAAGWVSLLQPAQSAYKSDPTNDWFANTYGISQGALHQHQMTTIHKLQMEAQSSDFMVRYNAETELRKLRNNPWYNEQFAMYDQQQQMMRANQPHLNPGVFAPGQYNVGGQQQFGSLGNLPQSDTLGDDLLSPMSDQLQCKPEDFHKPKVTAKPKKK